MSTRETRLPTSSLMADNDKIRIVQQDSSRNITYADFTKELVANTGGTSDQSFFTTTGDYIIDINSPANIFCDTQLTSINVTLPNAASVITGTNVSRIFNIKKVRGNSNDVSVFTTAGQLIDGQADVLLSGSSFPYVQLISNGTAWYIVGA